MVVAPSEVDVVIAGSKSVFGVPAICRLVGMAIL